MGEECRPFRQQAVLLRCWRVLGGASVEGLWLWARSAGPFASKLCCYGVGRFWVVLPWEHSLLAKGPKGAQQQSRQAGILRAEFRGAGHE